jgi:hypothetical protein
VSTHKLLISNFFQSFEFAHNFKHISFQTVVFFRVFLVLSFLLFLFEPVAQPLNSFVI